MKPSPSLIITLFFLLWFSFTITKPLSLASAVDQVIDLDGEPLSAGQEYYMEGAIWGSGAGGGGVTPEKTRNSSCAYSVIQESSDLNNGVLVKFRIAGKSTGTISPGSNDLEIEFVNKPNCAESSKWVVAYKSGSSLSSGMLVIGGPKDHPGAKLVSGFFKIEVYYIFSYKLMFCPESNFRGAASCYNVGIGYVDGYRHLVLEKIDEAPFVVVFEKPSSGVGKSIV